MVSMENFDMFLGQVRDWVWGIPLLLLLLGTGIYLTIMLKGMQFRYLGYAFKQVVARQKEGLRRGYQPF